MGIGEVVVDVLAGEVVGVRVAVQLMVGVPIVGEELQVFVVVVVSCQLLAMKAAIVQHSKQLLYPLVVVVVGTEQEVPSWESAYVVGVVDNVVEVDVAIVVEHSSCPSLTIVVAGNDGIVVVVGSSCNTAHPWVQDGVGVASQFELCTWPTPASDSGSHALWRRAALGAGSSPAWRKRHQQQLHYCPA